MKPSQVMWRPCLGLLFNAFVWGVSWLPLRHLQNMGLHPLWATTVFFALGAFFITLWQPQAWRDIGRSRAMWYLAIASGSTNAAFNWAVSAGDVVRVVLLFYLMPLWAIGLSWAMMGERITPHAILRVLLALGGAVMVLWPEQTSQASFNGWADVMGLIGGFCFAWTNVLLRQQAQSAASSRALAMFVGGTLWPLAVGIGLYAFGWISPMPALQWPWVVLALSMALAFFISNLALQYGAARLPVQITAVVMLTEILFATVSSMVWGETVLTLQVVGGGALILLAALLASFDTKHSS